MTWFIPFLNLLTYSAWFWQKPVSFFSVLSCKVLQISNVVQAILRFKEETNFFKSQNWMFPLVNVAFKLALRVKSSCQDATTPLLLKVGD